MDIRTVIKIDALIKQRASGNAAQLGNKLGISERAVYKYIKFMKEELNAPITYSKPSESYKYTHGGGFFFNWKND